MKLSTTFRTAALAVALGAVGTANAASLIFNGSFEDPLQKEGTWGTYYGTTVTGWTAGANGIEIRNSAVGEAQDGQNFVELDTNRNSSMYQTIATVVGQMYELSFWYSPRINQPASTNGIDVMWNNLQLGTDPTITGNGTSVNTWQLVKFLVLGTGSDTLTFAADGSSNSLGGNIDNVALSAVPLPGAALLFGTSLLAGAAARRKKQKQQATGSAIAA